VNEGLGLETASIAESGRLELGVLLRGVLKTLASPDGRSPAAVLKLKFMLSSRFLLALAVRRSSCGPIRSTTRATGRIAATSVGGDSSGGSAKKNPKDPARSTPGAG